MAQNEENIRRMVNVGTTKTVSDEFDKKLGEYKRKTDKKFLSASIICGEIMKRFSEDPEKVIKYLNL